MGIRLSLPAENSGRRVPHVFCVALVPISLLMGWSALPPGSGVSSRLSFSPGSFHQKELRRLHDQIPTTWRPRRRLLVQEVSEEELERLLAERESPLRALEVLDIDGFYHGGGDNPEEAATITLRETLGKEQALRVFSHEYGHFVWDEKLNEARRASYRRLWQAQKRARALLNPYAAESAEEGFAEIFSLFVREPARLQRLDQRSWQFLRSVQSSLLRPAVPSDSKRLPVSHRAE